MKEMLIEKQGLHPRNPHRFQYDFEALIKTEEALRRFVFTNKYNTQTIDFAKPEAVKMLNKAILKHFYGITYWDVPSHYLCPPIPGRADYIHVIADLLTLSNQGIIPQGRSIKVLDIGVGANCVYPIIGHTTYGWQFVGSDIVIDAIASAKKIVEKNAFLVGNVELRLQTILNNIFKGIILSDEVFDVSICNPPFHPSMEAATKETQRKIKNLTGKNSKTPVLNFGGQNAELWCEGGEKQFILKMIEESVLMNNQCVWFTSLVSQKEHLNSIYRALKNTKVTDFQTINIAQGQKSSRIVAWTFWSVQQRESFYKQN